MKRWEIFFLLLIFSKFWMDLEGSWDIEGLEEEALLAWTKKFVILLSCLRISMSHSGVSGIKNNHYSFYRKKWHCADSAVWRAGHLQHWEKMEKRDNTRRIWHYWWLMECCDRKKKAIMLSLVTVELKKSGRKLLSTKRKSETIIPHRLIHCFLNYCMPNFISHIFIPFLVVMVE